MKPYLNEREASEYCGCSKAHFDKKWKPNLESRMIHGKRIYMTAGLEREMQRLWQLSSGEERTGTLHTYRIKERDGQLDEYLKRMQPLGSEVFGDI